MPMTNILFSLFGQQHINLTTTIIQRKTEKSNMAVCRKGCLKKEKREKNVVFFFFSLFIGDIKTKKNRLKLLQKAEFFVVHHLFHAIGLTPFSSGVTQTQKERLFVTVLQ